MAYLSSPSWLVVGGEAAIVVVAVEVGGFDEFANLAVVLRRVVCMTNHDAHIPGPPHSLSTTSALAPHVIYNSL